MDAKFQNDRPIDEQPLQVGHALRLAIVSCAIVFPVVFCILLKPVAAEAAWTTVAHILQIPGRTASAKSFDLSNANLEALRPQQQAEFFLNAAVNQAPGATDAIRNHTESWRGHLKATPELSGLLDRALNSSNLNVRAAAIETELAENNLAKDSRAAVGVIARIKNEPSVRPWGLWMLGALGNRGVDKDRALAILSAYSRDPNETTRYWAVEGMSMLASDASVQPLLTVLRTDSEANIRDRAACALSRSGMLTKEQRLTAVPALIDMAGDVSLEAGTRQLAYRALRDITGKNIETSAAVWRSWWAENGQQEISAAHDATLIERTN